MAKATSISAANLAKFTQAAVKAATPDVPGRLILKGPTMGYILAKELSAGKALTLATAITEGVSANARQAGLSGIKPKPTVITRPGNITIGFIAQELGIPVRG
jgi:hypothetical protein